MDYPPLGLLRQAWGKAVIKLNGLAIPPKTLIVLPAYNVSSAIRDVVSLLPKTQTVVVDDGSADGTYEIVTSLGYTVIKHPINLGLSAAIATGEQYAVQHGYTHALFLDSDGQHPAELHSQFISALENADFVVGDRFYQLDGIPPQKIASNLFASLLVKEITGIFIRDVSCGYRGYKLKCTSAVVRPIGYTEIYAQILNAATSGVIPARVPVPAIYDLTQPLATKCSEIYGLCGALSYYSPRLSLLPDVLDLIGRKADFKIEVGGVNFNAHHVESWSSYVFSTDQTIAARLYGN